MLYAKFWQLHSLMHSLPSEHSWTLIILWKANGLTPNRHQDITWTSIDLLLFRAVGTNMREICIKIKTSNGSWCMGIKGEMSGTVCVTFTWDMYIYIYELFIAFVFLLFVHYCNLMVCVVYWVGKWRSRGSTGMFGNLMAIYHIMLQFIQNHYKSTFS